MLPSGLRTHSPTFAERLSLLFDLMPPPGRTRYTSVEVVRALVSTGTSMSAPYLSQLRSGQREAPSSRTVAALARFFGVSEEFFSDDRVFYEVSAELRLYVQMREPRLRQLMVRLAGLSPAALAQVDVYIDELLRTDTLRVSQAG